MEDQDEGFAGNDQLTEELEQVFQEEPLQKDDDDDDDVSVGAQLLSVRSHFERAGYMSLHPSLDIHFLRSFGVISL